MKKLIPALFLLLALPAHATDDEGTPINETRPLNPDGRVRVSNVAGLVEVKAWDKNEVRVTGTLGHGSERLDIAGGPAELRIEVKLPKRSGDVEGSELYVQVPEGARIELEGVSADLTLLGTRGAARLATVSGDVTVAAGMRELRAESVSGDVHVKAPSADTRVESVSGDVVAEKVTGVLRVETVSGDAHVSGEGFTEVDVETVSGDFSISIGSLAANAEVSGDSVSGNFELTLPKSVNASIELSTFSGELRSDFGKPDRDGDRLHVTVGQGQARIEVDSHSGDITLRQR